MPSARHPVPWARRAEVDLAQTMEKPGIKPSQCHFIPPVPPTLIVESDRNCWESDLIRGFPVFADPFSMGLGLSRVMPGARREDDR